MKMKNWKFSLTMLLAIAFLASVSTLMIGCDDDEPEALSLTGLTAGSIDLNGASSPNNVPTTGSYTATFSTNVDATTVTAENIKIVRDYDDMELPLEFSTAGNVVTITPEETLGTGTLYILSIGAGLKSSEGKTLSQALERNFTTEGAFAPAGVMAHFTFEDNTNDVVGTYDPTAADVVGITYVQSRKTAAGKAASFDGATSIIEVPNADDFMENKDFAISFWVKADGTENGQFVLGLAGWYGFQFEIAGDWAWVKLATRYDQGDGTADGEDAWYNGNGQTKDTNPAGWQGWTVNKDVTASGGVGTTYFKDKWANVVVTYNATTKVNTMYINGEKVKEHDFNLWPSDSKKKNIVGVKYSGNTAPGNELALGFIQARENRVISDTWADFAHADAGNKFKGLLDDVRIFSKPLTATEVSLMYNSEKP
jgi:hypothetical protein